MDKITKLSQAIELGSQLHPQAHGTWTGQNEKGITTCALQAAIEAIYAFSGQSKKMDGSDLKNRFPFLGERVSEVIWSAVYPRRKYRQMSFQRFIIDLNDRKKLTRENIALIVKMFEP